MVPIVSRWVLVKKRQSPGDGRIGLRERLIDRFGTVGQTCQEDPFSGEIDRSQFHVGLEEETIRIERHLEHLRKALIFMGSNDSRAQDHAIGPDEKVVMEDQVHGR